MACLLVSQQEAERRLKVSLQRGYDLISLGNSGMVTDWNAHIEKCFSWADLTIEMLSATIDDPPFVNDQVGKRGRSETLNPSGAS